MLPKIWKKFLLAVCIIAILFNITSKLVNRISLEKTILSSPEGINVKELFNITEETSVTSNNNSENYTSNTEDSAVNSEDDNRNNYSNYSGEDYAEPVENADDYQEDVYEEDNQITDITDSAILAY